MKDKASSTSCSKESNVFKMIAEALGVLSVEWRTNLSTMSFSFVVLMEVGRFLKRIFFIPGIQSIVVSKYPFVR